MRNAEFGLRNAGDGLLMVQGPLGLNWRSRKAGVLPRLENGEISEANPATLSRMALWQRLQVHVAGRPEWVVVKLHTHGLSARSRGGIVGPAMRRFHQALAAAARANGAQDAAILHYVSTRELYNIIKAAEAGHAGNPGDWRNYELAPPPCLADTVKIDKTI